MAAGMKTMEMLRLVQDRSCFKSMVETWNSDMALQEEDGLVYIEGYTTHLCERERGLKNGKFGVT